MKSRSNLPSLNQRYWNNFDAKIKESKKIDLGHLRAEDVMTSQYVCMLETETVKSVLAELREKKVTTALIVNGDNEPVGLFSEQEMLNYSLDNEEDSEGDNIWAFHSNMLKDIMVPEEQSRMVKKWMSPKVYVVDHFNDLEEVCRVFKVSGLPMIFVKKGSHVVGAISAKVLISRFTHIVLEKKLNLFSLNERNKRILSQ